MSEVHSKYNDEIDLIAIFMTLWDGKWKIIVVALVSLLIAYGLTSNTPNFRATTKIKPLTTTEAEVYEQFNAITESENGKEGDSYQFFDVTPSLLINLYLEQLDERAVFEQAIKKYKLLDVADYKNEEAFDEALIEFASNIEVLPTYEQINTEDTATMNYLTIRGVYDNEFKWKQLVSYVNLSANQLVRNYLEQKFNTAVSIASQNRDFKLEDISVQIENALLDYEIEKSYRLAYLSEQAAIARKLGVAKNTIESQTFSTQNGTLTNVETKPPFYLRGYEAIEKEIALIQSRKDIKPFVGGLQDLQREYRALKQDMKINRAESLFALTPISSTNSKDKKYFSAVSFELPATDFEIVKNRILMLVIATLIGGIIGTIYVLISNSIRKRKDKLIKA